MMRLTSRGLDNLTMIWAELRSVFEDCNASMTFDVEDAEDGILTVEVSIGRITINLPFDLAQGMIITGEDSTERVSESIIWRQVAFSLLREVEGRLA